MADLQEGFWENLLDYIADRTVIPVIGSELVTVQEDDREVPLHRWIARRLAGDLNLPVANLPHDFSLNDVVSMHLRRRGVQEELYARIHRLLRAAALTPSESLRTLAGIPGLDLFVSLTFDSLLADALGGARQIAYSPTSFRDLPCPKDELGQRVVFHLLGRASASPDFAICDDDLLEFVHVLQDKLKQPRTLFDELRGNHLLILGCSFGDWLSRFFLRTARNFPLSQKRRRWDYLIGDWIAHEDELALFLESFSPDTHVVPMTAPQFVAELGARWHAAHPAAAPPSAGKSIPKGAVFLSYASEDVEAASRLAEGLRSADLEVWFDQDALRWGEDWEASIRRGIRACALFLPVISRRSLSDENRRSYFWREWNAAADFTHAMAPDEVFLMPVVIDDTRIDRAALPDPFQRAQGRSLPDGKITPDVTALFVDLVRDFHRRQGAT